MRSCLLAGLIAAMSMDRQKRRYSLRDREALQLLGAALWHGGNWWMTRIKGAAVERFRDVFDDFKILFARLETPPEVLERGKTARLAEFEFTPEFLFRNQSLVWFLIEPVTEFKCEVDRTTRIAANKDLLNQMTIFRVFEDAAREHLDPPWERAPNQSSVEFAIFRELLGIVWRKPRGRGAPRRPRYKDHIDEAAAEALDIMETENLSRTEAVNIVLKTFKRVAPDKVPEGQRFIIATSDERARKRLLAALKKREKQEK